jgi:hypothetical protein
MSAAPPVASPSLLGQSRWRTFFNSLRPSSFGFGTPPARFGRPGIDSLATEKQFPELPQLESGLVCSQQNSMWRSSSPFSGFPTVKGI